MLRKLDSIRVLAGVSCAVFAAAAGAAESWKTPVRADARRLSALLSRG